MIIAQGGSLWTPLPFAVSYFSTVPKYAYF